VKEMSTYSLDYIDDLYVQYIQDPASVSPGWRQYFQEFSLAAQNELDGRLGGSDESLDGQLGEAYQQTLWLTRMQERIDQLVREYRVRGHMFAQVDPLGLMRLGDQAPDAELYGVTPEDLNRPFTCSALQYVNGRTLGDMLNKLRNTYCRSIGAQFMHIDNRNIRDWLQRRMESTENRLELSVRFRSGFTRVWRMPRFSKSLCVESSSVPRRSLWRGRRVSFRCWIGPWRRRASMD
jgi:2-oxoglutarate dehydrogenase E1 component